MGASFAEPFVYCESASFGPSWFLLQRRIYNVNLFVVSIESPKIYESTDSTVPPTPPFVSQAA